MSYRVLVVDDSSFFQIRLKEIINEHPDLSVVGVAANGHEAIELARKLKPDVISMDYEMPYMDGVSAIRAILAERTVPIVMFSSLTYEGAQATLEALEAGAVDFIPKNFADVSKNAQALKKKLHDTFLTFARKAAAEAYLAEQRTNKAPTPAAPLPVSRKATAAPEPAPLTAPATTPLTAPRTVNEPSNAPVRATARLKLVGKIDLVVIGSSTGGPMALTEVLTKLPENFRYPVVVAQHMPENFTKALADRLHKQCNIKVVEARDGDAVTPGTVYVAPGGHQCIFDRRHKIKIMDADERVNYKPSVDVTFASAASVYGGRVLGVVLTGMGADGCEGARLLKQKGAFVWAQDQASCVVYGMPKAVAQAGLADEVLALKDIAQRLTEC